MTYSTQKSWLSSFGENSTSIVNNLGQIREYAHLAFDRLDKDKNGFIEQSELLHAITDKELSENERSFVEFLLSNQQQIEEAADEGGAQPKGISKQDIEAYFDLIGSLL